MEVANYMVISMFMPRIGGTGRKHFERIEEDINATLDCYWVY